MLIKGDRDSTDPKKKLPEAPPALEAPIYDNHTHLTSHFGQEAVSYRDVLNTAQAAGVKGVVQVGFDLETSIRSVAMAQEDPRVLAAVAIHPNDASILEEQGRLDDALAKLDELAGEPRVRAIGETGLDYFRTPPERIGAQKDSFRRHLELARRHGIAVQIHDRDAHEDVVAILKDLKQADKLPPAVVFHCFSGDRHLARICNENGWYMSFSGTVTFKNAKNIHEAARTADRKLILTETDSPFLCPHPFRGYRNFSYMVPYVARALAQLRNENLKELCLQTATNTESVYGQWGDQ